MAVPEKAFTDAPLREPLPAQPGHAPDFSANGKLLGPVDPPSDQWIRSAIDRFETPLLRYAARLIDDHDRARDVVQETFAALCGQSPVELDGRLTEWLYTVCRNRALDVRRKERRMTTITHAALDLRIAPEPSPEQAAESRDSAGGVLKQLAHLSANQQEVVRLKFQHGLSYREIAGVTGLTVSNVGFLLHTAIATLREKLAAVEP